MAGIANTKGVDISYWNGDIDLSKVKNAGYKWVMIRCGWGNDFKATDDSRFATNVAKAEKLGMPWGVYLFSYACSTSDAKSELEHIDRLLKEQKAKGYLPTLPIAIDIEPTDEVQNKGGWTSSNLTNVATIVLDGLKSRGYYPIIYTGYEELAMMNDHIRNDYDCWFAQWSSRPSAYKYNRLGMWQYGGETNYIDSPTISGVGVIDQDIAYKDYPAIIKNGGYNGWAKETPKPTDFKLGCKSVHTYAWCRYAFWQTGAKNPKWSTSNTSISKIDANGVLSTSAAGTTVVTCTDGNRSISVPVTIDNGISTGISKNAITIDKGQTYTLTAKTKNVSWWSSNTNVATVSKGKVTAKSNGYATISAYTSSGASTCLVYVTNNAYVPSTTSITENQLRQMVASTINGWVGAVKGDKTHKEILDIYNSQKNLPYGYKMSVSDAWCAATVSAAWLKVGIADYIATDCNCGGFRDKAIKLGIWVEDDAYQPKIGDAIIYNWSDSGVGDNKGSADHIGLVTAIYGKSFTVTEGNMGGGVVGKRTMQVNGRYIRGFIAPDYAAIAKKVTGKVVLNNFGNTSTGKPSIYVQGVADGKWQKVVKNGAASVGVLGKPLVAFAVKTDKGSVEYSAHIKGGKWLGNITGWDYKDYKNGYAGNGNPAETGNALDCIKINYKTPQDVVNKLGYFKVAYKVHLLGGDWLDWQYDVETTNGQDGYAGILGKTIDLIKVELVEA